MATDLMAGTITPEQLAMMPNDKDFELVDGQLVERKMGNKSNWIASRLYKLLSIYVDDNNLGWLFTSEAGYRLHPERPKTIRKPDVSFVTFGRLPDEEPSDAYDYLAPDLAVEVISPGDTVRELEAKVDEYLRAGVRLVWVINPDLKTLTVHRPDGTLAVLREPEEIDGETVIPGFRCPLSSLFTLPSPRKGTKD